MTAGEVRQMLSTPPLVTRGEIRRWLRRRANHGQAKRIARELGVGKAMVSMWLSGRSPSRRLDMEVPRIVRQIQREQAAAAKEYAAELAS